MHVSIERLYNFVVAETDLTEAEQSHLIQCRFCVDWLDACVAVKVSLLRSGGSCKTGSTGVRDKATDGSKDR